MDSAIDALEARLGANWGAIRTARDKTEEIVASLGDSPKLPKLIRDFGVF